MKNGSLIVTQGTDRRERKHITAFTASKRKAGLQIEVAGCVCLQAAQNGSDKVIGIVELDDQTVPVLDARKNSSDSISDLCCIVLFENLVNDTMIVTARLYEDACQVFDLIVEFMDHPSDNRKLYSIDEHTSGSQSQPVHQQS